MRRRTIADDHWWMVRGIVEVLPHIGPECVFECGTRFDDNLSQVIYERTKCKKRSTRLRLFNDSGMASVL